MVQMMNCRFNGGITAGGMKSKRNASDELSATQKFERETKPKICTEPALFYTACYRFGLYLQTNNSKI